MPQSSGFTSQILSISTVGKVYMYVHVHKMPIRYRTAVELPCRAVNIVNYSCNAVYVYTYLVYPVGIFRSNAFRPGVPTLQRGQAWHLSLQIRIRYCNRTDR